jgi:hypothetical protein
MASQHIRNPAEWALDQLRGAAIGAESTYESVRGIDKAALSASPTVHRRPRQSAAQQPPAAAISRSRCQWILPDLRRATRTSANI